VARSLAVLCAVLGLGFGAFDALAVRPEMLALARTGRRQTGTVIDTAGRVKAVPPRRARWTIAVDDPELGPQLVDGDGAVGAGGRVDVLCSTPARRCERQSLVAAYERWPRTPNMARAAVLFLAGAVATRVTRPRRPEA
jgi:hypothetical protein